MKAQDVIKSTHAMSTMVLKSYVNDLTDAELMQRPGAGCNHVAWQLGHLIASEVSLLESIAPGTAFALPEGFADQHSKDQAGCDDASKFLSKDEYLQLLDSVQAATIAAVDATPDDELDQPAPESFRSWCPTVGAMYVLISTHCMMHVGQFVPLRRALGKPIVI